MKLIIRYNRQTVPLDLPDDSKVSDLMESIKENLDLSQDKQKIIFSGKTLSDSASLLSSYKIGDGSKLLLMAKSGTVAVKAPAPMRQGIYTAALQPEFMNSAPHNKIIAQGVPDEAEKPFPSQMMVLPKTPFVVYNTEGKLSKLSFESDAMWIETEEAEKKEQREERIFYTDVKTHLLQEIPNYENKYVGLCLSTKYGKRWYYFIPNQYVSLIRKVLPN